jgi:large subunit ribosomal protein L25
MDQPALTARVRHLTGKGAARKLRKKDQIPAVFYGPKTEPVMLAVGYPELERITQHGGGENIILDLEIQSDDGSETRKAMLKELQVDPVMDTYIHADFYEISMDRVITVDVPIRLVNTPVGVSNGGILQHIRREFTISCLPDRLVEVINADVSNLDIGDSIHIRDLELPEGITSLEEDHLTVAVVVAPTVVHEAVEEEAVEEGEIIEEEAEPEMEKSEPS